MRRLSAAVLGLIIAMIGAPFEPQACAQEEVFEIRSRVTSGEGREVVQPQSRIDVRYSAERKGSKKFRADKRKSGKRARNRAKSGRRDSSHSRFRY